MTTHRCKDGTWQDGKARDCSTCHPRHESRGPAVCIRGFTTKSRRKRSLPGLSD